MSLPNLPRNPFYPEALGVDDLRPNLPFKVISGSGEAALSGTISKASADYVEDGWVGVTALIDGKEQPFRVCDFGVSCFPDGTWSSDYTISAAD